MDEKMVLRMEHVTMQFGGVVAVNDLSLDVPEGKIVALIGTPVLRLKSDYLAIATLGFAEILRAIFQWQTLGPITNGANMLKSFPTFADFNIWIASG